MAIEDQFKVSEETKKNIEKIGNEKETLDNKRNEHAEDVEQTNKRIHEQFTTGEPHSKRIKRDREQSPDGRSI